MQKMEIRSLYGNKWIEKRAWLIFVLLFIFNIQGCDEPSIDPPNYPDTLVGKIFLKSNSRRTSISNYNFTSESDVLEVFQYLSQDECDNIINASLLIQATYTYDHITGRINISRFKDPDENVISFHYTEMDETDALPALTLRDIYVYAPFWGASSFDFLQVYGCHSGPGTIRLNTETSVYFSATYNYDCDIPALLNKCSGEELSLNLDQLFSDSLHIVVNNAYELLELAKEEYGMQ